ncbi:MAG: ParA family protein [Anaerolineae bacterium]|jgi:chromosome partitioning protein
MTWDGTRTIAIVNQKGGVGKTTTAINLSAALAELEQKTLVVDLDPQGALSVGLGIEGASLDHTVYTAMMEPGFDINRVVYPLQPFLDLIPANIELASAEMELIAEIRREYILQRILDPIARGYDYILLDCPPSLGLLTINALTACNEALIPMQCEYFAMRGIRMLLQAIDWIKVRVNSDLELGGILVTMYSTGTIHHREVMDEVRAVFGTKVYRSVIQKSIRFAEAAVASQSLVEYAPEHKGTQSYRALAKEIVQQSLRR